MDITNKLLSDEELLDKLNELVQKCENTQWVPEQEKYLSDMVDIINTQKRLYAESVIGSNELDLIQRPPIINAVATSPHDIAHVNELNRDIEKQYQEYHKAMHRDQLRAEQRARIK